MSLVYKLVGFDRKTDRISVQYQIPRGYVEEALKIAKVDLPEDQLGDVPLSAQRAEKLAKILGKRIDTKANEYFLEPSGSSIRRRARA